MKQLVPSSSGISTPSAATKLHEATGWCFTPALSMYSRPLQHQQPNCTCWFATMRSGMWCTDCKARAVQGHTLALRHPSCRWWYSCNRGGCAHLPGSSDLRFWASVTALYCTLHTLSTSGTKRLNSSKQPQLPLAAAYGGKRQATAPYGQDGFSGMTVLWSARDGRSLSARQQWLRLLR